MVSIGFDIPTTSTHANATIAYQATAAGTGDLQFHLESGNSISEKLRIHSDGQIQAGTSAPTYLKYTGSAVPTNNNCGTLLGSNNIGLIGQYSSLNMPFDHSTATASGAWWMLGRSAGTTNEWGLCLLYTSPSPRDGLLSRMPSSA